MVDCDRGRPFFSRRASLRKSDLGSTVSPPEVDGRCDGVTVARPSKGGNWVGVKYLGVVLVLDILKCGYGSSNDCAAK